MVAFGCAAIIISSRVLLPTGESDGIAGQPQRAEQAAACKAIQELASSADSMTAEQAAGPESALKNIEQGPVGAVRIAIEGGRTDGGHECSLRLGHRAIIAQW